MNMKMLAAAGVFLFVATAAGLDIPLVDFDGCSFPFTYGGNVHRSCIPNIVNVTVGDQVGCYGINRTGSICSEQAIGISCPFSSESDCGWTVIMEKQNFSTYSWSKNWAEYKNGFGTPGQDFWLGLEQIYQLTSSGNYRLRVEVLKTGTYQWFSGEYWKFSVGNEASGYALQADGYVGGDMLTDGFNYAQSAPAWKQNGMKFSTYDVDNDNSASNCSAVYGNVGWWYNSCYWAMLVGNTYTLNVWPIGTSTTQRYTLRGARMLIKEQPLLK